MADARRRGPPDTWPLLEARLAPDPRLDVAVITHIDSDHIGGMVPYFQSPLARTVATSGSTGGPTCRTPAAPAASPRASRSSLPARRGRGAGPRRDAGAELPWNLAFGGGPIDTGDEGGFLEVHVPDGPRITVLSPTTKRLTALATMWQRAIEEARRGTGWTRGPTNLLP